MPTVKIPIIHRSIAALVLISVSFTAVAVTEEMEPVSVKLVDGTVRKKSPRSEGWLTIDSSSTIAEGDSVKTLEKSRAVISLPGTGIIRLGSSSTLSFGDASLSIPELVNGEIWVKYDFEGQHPENLTVLPNAHVYASQAEARFSAGDDCTTEIKVYNGEIRLVKRQWYGYDEVLQENESDRHPCDIESSEADSVFDYDVILDSGQKLILSAKGRIMYQGPFSPDDPDEQTDWVRWNLDRDK